MRLPTIASPAEHLRTNKNWYVLVVAILLGVVGIYLANDFIQQRVATVEAQLRGDAKTLKVVVPKTDLPAGARVSVADMAIREVPAAFVHRDAVTPDKFDVAEGQGLSFQVDQGKPLLWAHLESGRTPTFSGKLPNGRRAVTVPVDEINSISGMLQPKDKIDLILTINRDGSKVTFPLLQDVLVLATGVQLTPERSGGNGAAIERFRTVTLQATPEEANMIILAQDAGKLTAVLRHPEDAKILPRERLTVAHLFGATAVAAPRAKDVEFIIGGR